MSENFISRMVKGQGKTTIHKFIEQAIDWETITDEQKKILAQYYGLGVDYSNSNAELLTTGKFELIISPEKPFTFQKYLELPVNHPIKKMFCAVDKSVPQNKPNLPDIPLPVELL